MKHKDRCAIHPPEVNHGRYAYTIGRKRGEDGARSVNSRVDGVTGTEAVRRLESFRARTRTSDEYSDLLDGMSRVERVAFWDGLEEGFMREIRRDDG